MIPSVGEGLARDSRLPLMVDVMYGLGDTVYQRPMLRALGDAFGEIFVASPWPELLDDLPGVRLCQPKGCGKLRTQLKNANRQTARSWVQAPIRSQTLTAYYVRRSTPNVNIVQELEKTLPMNGRPFVFDLPRFGPPPIADPGKPYAVVRPCTLRREWINPARNPLPEYVAEATTMLQAAGYHTVSIADLDPPHEWMLEPYPECDEHFLRGQLDVSQLMALLQGASVVVGGVGFIVPCSIALRTPLICIAGGQGDHNAPEVVTDPRMDLRRVQWIMPDKYCRCGERLHECPRTITGFAAKFSRALARVTRPVEAVA